MGIALARRHNPFTKQADAGAEAIGAGIVFKRG
jgi:hypothetical protein